MKKKIFDSFLKILSKIILKKVVYIDSAYIKPKNLAVKSSYGFWYCGNVFNQSDIAYGIANSGDVETFETETVVKILKHLDKGPELTFYDIGANTGWYTMLPVSLSKNIFVHAFEPLLEHVEILKESIFLNRKEAQIHVHTVALSDKDGEASILLAGSGSSLEEDFLEESVGKKKITIRTLDSYIVEKKLPPPHFIKIDVEGHEHSVISGSEKTLQEHLPILFIEIAYSLKKIGRTFTHKNYEKIFHNFEMLNYIPFLLKEGSLQKFNPANKEDGVFMFLFLHKEKHSDLINRVVC